jgi:hypothetical protein
MNVTSLTSWKSYDVVPNASFTRPISQLEAELDLLRGTYFLRSRIELRQSQWPCIVVTKQDGNPWRCLECVTRHDVSHCSVVAAVITELCISAAYRIIVPPVPHYLALTAKEVFLCFTLVVQNITLTILALQLRWRNYLIQLSSIDLTTPQPSRPIDGVRRTRGEHEP